MRPPESVRILLPALPPPSLPPLDRALATFPDRVKKEAFVRSFHEGGNHPEEEVRKDAAESGDKREKRGEERRAGEGKREEESLSERGEREREICISIAVVLGESVYN